MKLHEKLNSKGYVIFSIENMKVFKKLRDSVTHKIFNETGKDINLLRKKMAKMSNVEINDSMINLLSLSGASEMMIGSCQNVVEMLCGKELFIQRRANTIFNLPGKDQRRQWPHYEMMSGISPFTYVLWAPFHDLDDDGGVYYFDKKKSEGYYDKNGISIKKALMKSPINGARLSSAFGMRKHPIDGYNKMHKGTDFAAPMGTPIMASGDGVITRAKWCGGGGNCIKIKHNFTYQTIYAHMKSFARGIKLGLRVKQGQIIGYVGSTGNSTGPHLHYEVIENGKKINSQKLKLPSGKTLKGVERKLFEIKKIKLDVLKSELIMGLN